MKKETLEIYNILTRAKKGHFIYVQTRKELECKDGSVLVKESAYVCRYGIDYENLASTKAKRAENPIVASSAPKSAIVHMDDDNILFRNKETGKWFVRFYKGGKKAKTRWTRNGKPITLEEILALNIIAPSKVKPSTTDTPCWFVPIENIVAINGQAL